MSTLKPPPQIISRLAAHGMGLSRYFTGVPCKNGHLTERYVSNAGCTACVNTMFQRRRNSFSHELVPFASTRMWNCKGLTVEEARGMESFLQGCIVQYVKHLGKLTVELEDAFRMQMERML